MNAVRAPHVVVLDGPNGAEKSTVVPRHLRAAPAAFEELQASLTDG